MNVTHVQRQGRRIYDTDLACGVVQRGGYRGICSCGEQTPWCYRYETARDLILTHKRAAHPASDVQRNVAASLSPDKGKGS